MPVVTFLNQKGGVGKSSSVHHLGGAFAQAGRRVLLAEQERALIARGRPNAALRALSEKVGFARSDTGSESATS